MKYIPRYICQSCLILLLSGLFSLWLSPGAAQAKTPEEAQRLFDEVRPVEFLTTMPARNAALENLKEAASIWQDAGNKPALIRTLNRISEIQLKLCQPEEARKTAYDQALPQARTNGNPELLVDTLVAAGIADIALDKAEEASSLLTEALTLSQQAQYRQGEAQSLTFRSNANWGRGPGYYEEGREDAAAALAIWPELQDKRGQARAYYFLGDAYMMLSESAQSAQAYEKALALWQETGDKNEQASTLIEHGFLVNRQGLWQKSWELFTQAESLLENKEAEPFMAGQIAANLGDFYKTFGQADAALQKYQEALHFYRDEAHSRLGEMDLTCLVGVAQSMRGDKAEALATINYSIQLAQQYNKTFQIALSREEQGRIYLELGEHDRAQTALEEALGLYRKGKNMREIARVLTLLGDNYYRQSQYPAAASKYREAWQIFQTTHDVTNEAALYFGRGQVEMAQKHFAKAEEYLKTSISMTENLRGNGVSKELRSSLLDSVYDRYETYIECLMQKHAAHPHDNFAVTAFEASESGRARAMLDALKNAGGEIRQIISPELLAEEEKLEAQRQAVLDKQAELSSKGRLAGHSDEAVQELQIVNTKFEALQVRINQAYPGLAHLLNPPSLSLNDIQKQVLDDETVLLEYSLGQEKSYLWVVTNNDINSYELPGKNIIDDQVKKVRDLITGPFAEPRPNEAAKAVMRQELRQANADLGNMLLGQAWPKLNRPRIIVVADGALQYLPFQMLAAPNATNEPLIEHYEIINAPSASTLALTRQNTAQRQPNSKLLAGIGDPVLPPQTNPPADSLLAGADPKHVNSRNVPEGFLDPTRLSRVFSAKAELNRLYKLGGSDETDILSAFDATRTNLLKMDLGKYRILHFATHGLVNSSHPEFSGLVLSLRDSNNQPISGFVSLADIYTLHAPVDLVVMSACQTALGKDMRGEGLIGLTRGFMYAGASSVASSLWKVDDETTGDLMQLFYTNMLEKGMPTGAALRAAQIEIRKQSGGDDPYFWAAFTLQGEYRQFIHPAAHPVRQTVTASQTAQTVKLGGVLVALLAGAAIIHRYRKTIVLK